MKEDRSQLRELIEENKMLLEELRILQTKYVQEKLFSQKNAVEDTLNHEIELEQKVDILIRYLVTGRTTNKDQNTLHYNKTDEEKISQELTLYDYAFLLKKFETAGFKGVQKYLEDLPVSGKVRAQAWKGLATRLSEENMRNAAGAAWRAWLADPAPERLKWLAFRMYEADEVFLADILIRMLPVEMVLSEEENRKRLAIQERLRKRTGYLRGLREMERANVSALRKKIMRLETQQEYVEQLEKDKKNLLFMIQLKDEYLEKVNLENAKYKNIMKSIKDQCV